MKAISDILGLNFEEIRDLWLLDKRMGSSHNEVTEEGGFGGMCLPKDINALIYFAQEAGYSPKLIKEIWNTNTRFNKNFKDAHRYE